jgi:hypothetical protein
MIRARSLKCGIALSLLACSVATAADFPQMPHCTATTAAPVRQERFARLVCIRTSAIETAFGQLFDGRDIAIRIELTTSDEPAYPRVAMSSYDPAEHTLYFRRGVIATLADGGYKWALAYWPYYRSEVARAEYPEIAIVDEALWNAHLQQAAHELGLSWPHADCSAIDIARRLGCEMVSTAIGELAHAPGMPLFNANRLDRLWPENLKEFERRAWTHGGREYREVRRLGGLLLVEPLIREFGVPRVFAYVARTPFRIENDNVRVSALRYQERARSALAW